MNGAARLCATGPVGVYSNNSRSAWLDTVAIGACRKDACQQGKNHNDGDIDSKDNSSPFSGFETRFRKQKYAGNYSKDGSYMRQGTDMGIFSGGECNLRRQP